MSDAVRLVPESAPPPAARDADRLDHGQAPPLSATQQAVLALGEHGGVSLTAYMAPVGHEAHDVAGDARDRRHDAIDSHCSSGRSQGRSTNVGCPGHVVRWNVTDREGYGATAVSSSLAWPEEPIGYVGEDS